MVLLVLVPGVGKGIIGAAQRYFSSGIIHCWCSGYRTASVAEI